MRRRLLGATLALITSMSLLGVVTASPSSADPSGSPTHRQLAGVGGVVGTGVMNAYSDAITVDGQKVLGHYDPRESAEVVRTKSGDANCAVLRSTGSDVSALQRFRDAVDSDNGCLSYATVGYTWNPGETKNGLKYIQFGTDVLSYAVSQGGNIPRDLTFEEVRSLYRCEEPGIYPLLPAPGWGQRQKWLGLMGITESQLAADWYPCVRDTINGSPVAENDGRVLSANALMPFSVGNWLAQDAGQDVDLRGPSDLAWFSDYGLPLELNTSSFPVDETYATKDGSSVPRDLSFSDLAQIYRCEVSGLDPVLPSAGALRTSWLSRLGITEAQVAANEFPCIRQTQSGTAIAPNDGRVGSELTVIPFSRSAWHSQQFGFASDVRGASDLAAMVPTAQGEGLPRRAVLYDSLAYQLYNVIPAAKANISPWNQVFVGPNSLICQDTATRERLGLLPAPQVSPGGLQGGCGGVVWDTTDADGINVWPYNNNPFVPLSVTKQGGSDYSSNPIHRLQNGHCGLAGGFSNDHQGVAVTAINAKVWTDQPGANCWTQIVGKQYCYADRKLRSFATTLATTGSKRLQTTLPSGNRGGETGCVMAELKMTVSQGGPPPSVGASGSFTLSNPNWVTPLGTIAINPTYTVT